MIKYLVTGAGGHLGNIIVKKLCDSGKSVKVLLMENEKDINYLPPNIEKCVGDVTNIEDLNNFFSCDKADKLVVIHCAAIVSIKSKFDINVYNVNVNGTKNIVDMCVKNGISKLIYVSSVHAIEAAKDGSVIKESTEFDYVKLSGLYSQTKAIATQYVLDATKEGLNVSILHPSGIIGPYDYKNGHLTQLIISYMRNKLPAIVGGGYDFVDARDVADGIINSIKYGKNGECYILSNQFYSISKIINMMSQITEKKEIKTVLPYQFVNMIMPFADMYYKLKKATPLFTKDSIETLNSNANFSHEKADKDLKYKVREMRETLNDTINWLDKNKRI